MPREGTFPVKALAQRGSPLSVPDRHGQSALTRVGRSDFYGAAATLLVLSLALKILGVVQQALLAYLFGANGELDAFLVAVSMPMLAVSILSSGSLSLAFVPLFSEYHSRGEQDNAWLSASVVANWSIAVALIVLLVGTIGAPAIARWLGPGFDAPAQRLTTSLFVILLPTVGLATLSAMIKSVLYFFRRFGPPNLAYVIGSLLLLGTVLLLHRHIGVRAVAWGMVLSASVAVAIQLLVLRRVKPRYRFSFDVRLVGVRQTGLLLLGMTLSIVAMQLNLVVDRAFATRLGAGSVSILEYAADFDKLIVSTFALSAAAAIYPILADLFSWAREQEFADRLSATVQTVALAVLPLATVALVLRRQIIGVVLQRGEFGPAQTEAVAKVLICLMPALVAWAFMYTGLNAFFARRESSVPVAVMLGVLAVNAGLAAWLGPILGVPGLALGTSISAWAGNGVLWGVLFRQVTATRLRSLGIELAKISLAAVLSGFACWGVAWLVQGWLPADGLTGRATALALAGGAAAAAYAVALRLLGVDEARPLARWAADNVRWVITRTRPVGSD